MGSDGEGRRERWAKFIETFKTLMLFGLGSYGQQAVMSLTSLNSSPSGNIILALLAGSAAGLCMIVSTEFGVLKTKVPWFDYLSHEMLSPFFSSMYSLVIGVATAAISRASDSMTLDGSPQSVVLSMVIVAFILTTITNIVGSSGT